MDIELLATAVGIPLLLADIAEPEVPDDVLPMTPFEPVECDVDTVETTVTTGDPQYLHVDDADQDEIPEISVPDTDTAGNDTHISDIEQGCCGFQTNPSPFLQPLYRDSLKILEELNILPLYDQWSNVLTYLYLQLPVMMQQSAVARGRLRWCF